MSMSTAEAEMLELTGNEHEYSKGGDVGTHRQ